MSLHNEKNFKEFLKLKHLINCNPVDKSLLKKELAGNYYFKIKTISDLRRHMSEDTERNFFGRSARNFFKTVKYKFSKKDFTVTCYNDNGMRQVVYQVIFSGENLTLFTV